MTARPTIGFIGQGFIGKNYADDFEERGFVVIRYALEEPYRSNKERIAECDIVFIAVPTPTTQHGFDSSIVAEAVSLVGAGKTAVIKSTVLPGTTDAIQERYSDRFVMMSPEFLTEATAAHDARHPHRNIVGIPLQTPEYEHRAQQVLAVLPKAPYHAIVRSKEAEYIKYGGNNWFYFKVIFINILYDLVRSDGCDWDVIKKGMAADPRIGSSHLNPVHAGGVIGETPLKFNELHLEPVHKSGRGAGGHCFIKDFAAFSKLYAGRFPDDAHGIAVLQALECKNIDLLTGTGKDLDILAGVYGAKPELLCDSSSLLKR